MRQEYQDAVLTQAMDVQTWQGSRSPRGRILWGGKFWTCVAEPEGGLQETWTVCVVLSGFFFTSGSTTDFPVSSFSPVTAHSLNTSERYQILPLHCVCLSNMDCDYMRVSCI